MKGYAVCQEAGETPASWYFLLIFRCVPGRPAVEWRKKTERQKKSGKEKRQKKTGRQSGRRSQERKNGKRKQEGRTAEEVRKRKTVEESENSRAAEESETGRTAEKGGKDITAEENGKEGRGMNLVQLLDAHTQWDELAVIGRGKTRGRRLPSWSEWRERTGRCGSMPCSSTVRPVKRSFAPRRSGSVGRHGLRLKATAVHSPVPGGTGVLNLGMLHWHEHSEQRSWTL
ncbi:hypothetical protein [Yanshouia hominis]|uniref:Uncharacterized protein n=1 Tax=Yanshouia hominis TaxID=2763673 RepID=A0ABR7NIB2_9FIRM|nr:hypothetical protein [Yanshouia hominis]MBC8575562.1 hypothetical protein [Yanshouia hominis]